MSIHFHSTAIISLGRGVALYFNNLKYMYINPRIIYGTFDVYSGEECENVREDEHQRHTGGNCFIKDQLELSAQVS